MSRKTKVHLKLIHSSELPPFRTLSHFVKTFALSAIRFAVLILGLFALILVRKSYASVPIKSVSGSEAHWNVNSNIRIRSNEVNQAGLAANSLFSIFTTSLNRWKQAASDAFSFTYYQGQDRARYPTIPAATNDSQIFFTSQTSGQNQLPCGVVAVTNVAFDDATGGIIRVDLRFNDQCYQFTGNPADTGVGNKIFLGDVATHELGHAMGLDHSQNVQSSMIYTAAIQMSKPGCDDHVAMTDKFSPSNLLSHVGGLRGRVVDPNGSPIFGAHVNIIHTETGIVKTSVLTDNTGNYEILGLEAGNYSVMTEPFYAGSASLGPYYAGMNPNVCSGRRFERSFSKTGGKLNVFPVYATAFTHAGDTTVSCNSPQSINSNQEAAIGTAPVIADSSSSLPVATQGRLSSAQNYYRLRNQIGFIYVGALSYSIYSNVDVDVEILNSSGVKISQTSYPNVFNNPSTGYTNFDAAASAQLNTMQDVYVRVVNKGQVPTNKFPANGTGVDPVPYYVLTVSSGFDTAVAIYPLNARCDAQDSFPQYPNQGEPSEVNSNSGSDDDAGGCGMIEDVSGGDGSGNTRMLNFMLMLIIIGLGIKMRKTKSQSY